MKKFLGVLMASAIVLVACGNEKNTESKSETKTEVNENEPTFKNDTLVLDDAVLKIEETLLVNDKDDDKKLVVFKYNVKNKSGSEDVSPNSVFLAGFNVYQDVENSIANLDVGFTPMTGEYEEWSKYADDTIKKGKTAKGIMSYELENQNNLTLKASKGIGGKKLGEKEIDLSELKTVDYSMTEDFMNEYNEDNQEEQVSDNKSNNPVAQTNVKESNTKQNLVANSETVNVTPNNQDNKNSAKASNNTSSVEISNSNNDIRNDISYNLPTEGIDGHPSLYNPNIAPPSPDNLRTDENGDVYYDATLE